MELKPINGFPNYLISNTGQVFSKNTNSFLQPQLSNRGYLQVGLFNNGKRQVKSIHRLVAEAFLPNPLQLEEINHIDENKTNNMVDNLEWINHIDNLKYGARPIKHAHAVGKTVLNIETNQQYYSIMEAARQTNIPKSSISVACHNPSRMAGGYHWKFVD